MKNAVIYARYSCDKQQEQSIDGQIRVIKEYAERNGYNIIRTYIDRAKSARTANRPEFLRLIQDSASKDFQAVLVYKLDRFSRNQYDTAIYKMKLKQNGVSIVSATEYLTDSPEGIITEAVLVAMAEFYSAELGQKTKRGMRESALKAMSVGSVPPLGYKWVNKKLQIDDNTADIPRIAFKMYAEGAGKKKIADYLNNCGYRTRQGGKFCISSFNTMFSNPKYIGIYNFEDIQIEGGCPALIDKELFDMCQEKLQKTKRTRANARAKAEYYLAGRLYCGHCGEPMIATGGTGTNNKQYHYYLCKGHKNHTCPKKPERKDFLEWFISDSVLDLLNVEKTMPKLADKVISAYTKQMKADKVGELEKKIQRIEAKQSAVIDMLCERKTPALLQKLDELEYQRGEIEEELTAARITAAHIPSRAEIIDWFKRLRAADSLNDNVIKLVISAFVYKVFLYDDRAVIALTLRDTKKTVEFGDIREALKEENETPESISFNYSGGDPSVKLNELFVIRDCLCLSVRI